ncbi:MAG: epoxyqueuosine reductase [Candidatus Methanomethylophilaceae archaeon]|nr:epoxyqueuosine reductase [Candidatus Methanomethylophilaceae archaeon]MDI3541880.1 epoxyqueuosine reductase [Candidatus Methanomethylophilaceae archaeon]
MNKDEEWVNHIQDLQDSLRAYAKESEISMIGFGPFSKLKDVRKLGDAPFELPTVVCIGVELPLDAVEDAKNRPSEKLRESYKVANKKMMVVAQGLEEMIRKAGYSTHIIHPADRVNKEDLLGPVSLKSIARICGMGWIGKNGLIVTKDFGPRIRFLAILTDMPLIEEPLPLKNQCGDCRECINECALKILKEPEFEDYPINRDSIIDWQRCGRFEAKLIGDGSRPERACGKCIAYCPRSYQ